LERLWPTSQRSQSATAKELATCLGPIYSVGPDILKEGNSHGRIEQMWASSSSVE
jgi:hypothetical protein